MIFLAVTMGFLAESLRENISDKEKEKEYISSFIDNLKKDTVDCAAVIRENQDKLDKLKKLIALSKANIRDTGVRRSLYRYTFQSVGFYSVFRSSDATMLQLKNSGGLRLIRKDHVADSIGQYDNEMKYIYAAETMYQNGTDAALLATQEILDYTVANDSTYEKGGRLAGALLPLLSDDDRKVRWMFNKIDYEIGATRNYLNNMRRRFPFMVRMIGYLQKEYDIE